MEAAALKQNKIMVNDDDDDDDNDNDDDGDNDDDDDDADDDADDVFPSHDWTSLKCMPSSIHVKAACESCLSSYQLNLSYTLGNSLVIKNATLKPLCLIPPYQLRYIHFKTIVKYISL